MASDPNLRKLTLKSKQVKKRCELKKFEKALKTPKQRKQKLTNNFIDS